MRIEDAVMSLMVGTHQVAGECEDARHFRDCFVTRKNQILFALIGATNSIAGNVNDAATARELAESSIRSIEAAIALEDNGLPLSGVNSRMDLHCHTLYWNERKLIKYQQNTHLFLKQFTDIVAELENLSKQLGEWMQTLEENSRIKEQASSLAGGIDGSLTMFASYAARVREDIDREPFGSTDQVVSKGVIKFREMLAGLRSHIRACLAAEAWVRRNNENA